VTLVELEWFSTVCGRIPLRNARHQRRFTELSPYDPPVEELIRFWGVADNGEVMELAVRPHLVERLLERWPPVGLARHEEPVGPVVVQRGLSDEWIIIPDRDPSGDNPPLDRAVTG